MPSKKIHVGSKNKAKVAAVAEILQDYPHLADSIVEGFDVQSEVGEQPKSLEETIRGARNRARNAFNECDYAIGVESGVVEVPYSKSGYMDVCACAIFDGTDYHLGLSSLWEFPNPEVMRAVVEGNTDMSEVVNRFGLTTDANIGANAGAIGIVTKGRMDRKSYTQQALRTALVHIDI